jgi:peptidylprolyl isomerase
MDKNKLTPKSILFVVVILIVFIVLIFSEKIQFKKQVIEYNEGDEELIEIEDLPDSVLFMEIFEEGIGKEVTKEDIAVVDYTAIFENTGETFFSTLGGEPAEVTFDESGILEGLELSILGMKIGGKRIVVVPPEYGYGEEGVEGVVPPNSTLIFFLELIEIK